MSGSVLGLVSPVHTRSLAKASYGWGRKINCSVSFAVSATLGATAGPRWYESYEVVLKQAALTKTVRSNRGALDESAPLSWDLLSDACERFWNLISSIISRCICNLYGCSVWCRRTDELADGPNASYITATSLDRWEKRLDDLFKVQSYDMYDVALSDIISKYLVDSQVQ
jgi:hypothetical protein